MTLGFNRSGLLAWLCEQMWAHNRECDGEGTIRVSHNCDSKRASPLEAGNSHGAARGAQVKEEQNELGKEEVGVVLRGSGCMGAGDIGSPLSPCFCHAVRLYALYTHPKLITPYCKRDETVVTNRPRPCCSFLTLLC